MHTAQFLSSGLQALYHAQQHLQAIQDTETLEIAPEMAAIPAPSV
jgi:hypothetical protein